MRFQPGVRLGPYEITGPIGAGGMGEVYRARDSRLGREVAIKVLPRELATDRERLARFEREARSSSALNHRNIVTIHDFTSQDGEAWLVMELIDGESLRALVKRGPVPRKRLFSIASGVAQGLAAAHGAGIVHRDLKPENIMVTSDGTPKIVDFGLVKLSAIKPEDSTDLRASVTGGVMGTAGYMSPEQASGQSVDFRSDQFSFGIILYEMASGRHPFRRATGIQTVAAIMNDEAPPLAAELPKIFSWIIERCLEKNPAERYGSTSDLAHDLVRLRDGSDQARSPASPSKRGWPAVAVGASILTALISIAALAFVVSREDVPATSSPVYSSVYSPEMPEVHLGEQVVPIALSPNGRYLLMFGRDPHGTNQLALHDLRDGTTRLLAANGYNAAWSPDSTQIVFVADGMLKTISAEGGPARTVCAANPQGTVAWSGDSVVFSQYGENPGLYRVDAGGGKPELLYGDGTTGPIELWPQFLPDGKRFLYLTISPGSNTEEIQHELRVASLEKTPSRPVANIDSRAVYADGHLLFVRDGTLMAQPFDPDEARASGEARPIVEGVHYFRSTGNAAFTVADNGLLAWRSPKRPVRLVWMDPSGMELSHVASEPFHADGRLSSDEMEYVVSIADPKQGSADLWTWNLSRNSPQRLTYRLLDERMPVRSPDGRTLYYRSDRRGPPDIFRLTSGVQSEELLHSSPSLEEPQDVSPDGQSLLFLQYTLGGTDIAVLPLSPQGAPQPFVATPFSERSARFSPDGRRVSYVSNISGQPEVYVRPFDGSTPDVRISSEGGTTPRWRKDGGELYYLAPGGRFMAVAMRNGEPAASPRVLFQEERAVDFEVAANGTRFLMQIDQRRGEPEIRLLSNWTTRLASQPSAAE